MIDLSAQVVVTLLSNILISAPSEAPPNLSGYAVNSTTIALMWDAIALENQNGLLRHYLVSVLELDTGEIDMYTAGATQLNISGLHPYYTYNCVVAAVTIRIGPFSQSVSIITPQDGDLKIIFVDVTDFTRYVYLHLLKDNACFLCCKTVSIIIEEPAFIVSCCLLTIPNMTWLTFSLIGCSPIWFSLEFHN